MPFRTFWMGLVPLWSMRAFRHMFGAMPPRVILLRNTRLIEGCSATAQGPVVDCTEEKGGPRYFGDGRLLALPSMRRPRVLHEEGVLPQNPWSLRHEEEFTGRRFPFGCGVHFKPALTKYSVDKAYASSRFCICLGLGYPRVADGTGNT